MSLKFFMAKIKANQARYDLGREAAKISALFSKISLKAFWKNTDI